jgi:glycine/D-amino acid oxidase-like deaminating enzyme
VSIDAKVFKTSQLPESPGVCGWVAMLPPRSGTASLAQAITADVTVIGGGFAGLSAARRLTQIDPALKVVVLEAGVVGEGPAGRNSGFIIDLPHQVSAEDYGGDSLQKSRQYIALQRRAVTFATELAAEMGWGPETLDPCGRYDLAMTPKGDQHVAAYAAQLVRLGEAHTVLDAEAIAGVTGSRSFRSGIYMPGTVIVQPAAYVRGLADSLQAPARLFEQTPATSFERRGSIWLVRTPKGSVESPRIVLANNGYVERFGFFRGQLLHVYTYASMTEAFDPARLGGQRAWAATPASPMGTTLRRIRGRGGDRLLVRSRYTYNPSLNVSEATLRRAGALHDGKFAYRFPSLAGTRMEYCWGGAMALTRNSVPAFGEVETGIHAACGCNGLGASNATASGIAVAETLLGVESELTRIYRGFANPQSLPPQPLTIIGARTMLAVREWRAGVE